MRMNFNKIKWTVLAAAAVTLLAGESASAGLLSKASEQEFTTSDSVMTLQIPGDDWKEVSGSQAWVTLTDGDDRITLEHFSNGEKLPEITVAGEEYAQVCQNIISTEDEVFIITGAVTDKDDFEEVQKAVQSAVINKYGTKTAVRPAENAAETGTGSGEVNAAGPGNESGEVNAAGAENTSAAGAEDTSSSAEYSAGQDTAAGTQGTVEAASFTVWVTSQQLNIRSEASVSGAVLGVVSYMDALEVTGIEKAGGTATGWYQVNYNGTVGYVASEYTSVEPATAEISGYTLTEEQVTLYTEDGESAAYVYKAADGNWYDGSGRQYQADGTGRWTCLNSGAVWTETAPQTPEQKAVSQAEVTDEDGYNSQTLYLGEDGVWKNIAGGIYTDGGDGTWTGTDGTVWFGK